MDRGDRLAHAGLWLLLGFTTVALLGFAVFGLRPDRLAYLPSWAAAFYGTSFRFFAQGHVWLAGAVLAVHLTDRTRAAWVPALVVLYGISLASELLGTGRGIPFGEYGYSELLGGRWADRVPWVIPLSWFAMSVPAYAVARRAHPESRAATVALASLILMTWDLALDPAMSHATRYWVWGETGPYYGMPWLNLFGWYVTGLCLMSALAMLSADRWIARLSPGWLAAFFGVNLLLPLGMNAAAGLWGAVVVTLAVGGLVSAWVLRRARWVGEVKRQVRGRVAEVVR